MDVILQAADALAASSFIAPKKECVILKIQRRLDDLNNKMELILSLLKDKTEKTEKTETEKQKQKQKQKKVKISETEKKTRAVIKLASKEILKLSTSSVRTSSARTTKNSSSPSSSPTSSSSSSQSIKTKDYYEKYPEIKKKFWGVGPGRRSSSTLKKMDQLIAQLK